MTAQRQLLCAVASLAWAGCGHHSPVFTPDGGPGCQGLQVTDEGHFHVPYGQSVNCVNNPPASGNHWPCWAPYAVATTVVHREAWVHDLEHGGVVLLFQCADAASCPDAGTALAKVDADAPDAPTGGHRILVTADPTLPTPVAAVAWDWVLTANGVNEADLLCFIAAHEGMGPEDIAADGSSTCL